METPKHQKSGPTNKFQNAYELTQKLQTQKGNKLMLKNIITSIISTILIFSIFLVGCLENVIIPKLPTDPNADPFGTVFGTVIDAQTTNPIPNVTISLSDLETQTNVEGIFTFYDIPYTDEHELTINDPDYQNYTKNFTLDKEFLELKIELTPLNNAEEELEAFLDDFSELIESLDLENIPKIQALFSETYIASDDPVTVISLVVGFVPQNYQNIIPTFTKQFDKYSLLQFNITRKKIDITHARKASIELLLIIDSIHAEFNTKRVLETECVLDFHRENSDWKIINWKVLKLDVRL